jgi:hypothetical protein
MKEECTKTCGERQLVSSYRHTIGCTMLRKITTSSSSLLLLFNLVFVVWWLVKSSFLGARRRPPLSFRYIERTRIEMISLSNDEPSLVLHLLSVNLTFWEDSPVNCGHLCMPTVGHLVLAKW